MATGTQRRTVVQDSLQGAAEVVPVQSTAPSLSIPQAPVADVVNNVNTRISAGLGQWASKNFRDIADAKNMADELNGRMAFQQGQTLEDTEMEGNKWASQGYKVIQAETLSSTLLASQQELIRQSGYQLSPEEFRGQYVSQLEQQVSGLDPTTANFVSDSMSKQMPTLVAQHQSAYLADQEKQAYQSLVASVDVMSKDDTAVNEFFSNTIGGEGSASDFLSEDRRRAAVVEGTASAFEQGNPLAYSKLKAAGILENLSPAQRSKLSNAERRYQAKKRTTLDQGYISSLTTLERKIDTGDFSPDEILEERIQLDSDHGRDTSQAEGLDAYSAAAQAVELREQGDTLRIANARLMGKWETIADITEKFMIEAESGGDPDALGPVITVGSNNGTRAQGKYQVMPNTLRDPGFGVRPADIKDPTDVARAGKDYWRAMMGGSASSGVLKWAPGDIEAAAIAYNAGPGNANKWIEAGRDYSVLPQRSQTEPYAKGILAKSEGEGISQDARSSTKMAQDQYARIKKAMSAETLAAFQLNRQDLDEEYQRGDMTDEEYIANSTAMRRASGVEMSSAISRHTVSVVNDLHKKASKEIQEIHKVAVASDAAILESGFMAAVVNPDLSEPEREQVRNQYLRDIVDLYADAGLTIADAGFDNTTKNAMRTYQKGVEAHDKRQEENTLIDRASSTGTMPDLPVDLQRRGWKTITDNVNQYFADAAQAGRIPPEDVETQVKQALLSQYVSAGGVDPVEKDRSTAVMRGALMNASGEVNDDIAAVVNTYATLKATSPHVADSLLSPSQRVLAEAIISASGGPGADVRNGITYVSEAAFKNGGISSSVEEEKERAFALVQDSADDWISENDLGVFDWMLGSTPAGVVSDMTAAESDAINTPETRSMLEGKLHRRVAQMAKLSPSTPIDTLVKPAAEHVQRHTARIGRTVVTMDDGFSVRDQLFGSRANQVAFTGVESAAIQDYLAALSETENFGFISEVPASEPFIGATLTDFSETGPDIGLFDRTTLLQRRVRPYVIVSDGKVIKARILRLDGTYSVMIPLPLPLIGDTFIKKYRAQSK